ncbi:unnamed protein product [Pleuronectes platessa]|uniref:Uncharacterized protein n=1 Tax=Pleuronectes platessa TaxID=8262 RepID=A0A9N7U8P7_PLEPL|nr:unnamed protein product [Pleuronectes platessa]
MDDEDPTPSWPPICSSESSWPQALAGPAQRRVRSEPAHTDGYLLTLGPDAMASAHKYNVMLMPCGAWWTGWLPKDWNQSVSQAYGSFLKKLQDLLTFVNDVKIPFVD